MHCVRKKCNFSFAKYDFRTYNLHAFVSKKAPQQQCSQRLKEGFLPCLKRFYRNHLNCIFPWDQTTNPKDLCSKEKLEVYRELQFKVHQGALNKNLTAFGCIPEYPLCETKKWTSELFYAYEKAMSDEMVYAVFGKPLAKNVSIFTFTTFSSSVSWAKNKF